MIIVIANSYEMYKFWCYENNIDRKAEDCKYKYMINEYSVKGRNISQIIDISTEKNSDINRYLVAARYAVERETNIIED